MNEKPLSVGIIGCGHIADTYLHNASLFPGVTIKSCADIDACRSKKRAAEFGIQATSVHDMLQDKEIQLIINLTVPMAHFEVSLSALRAGKHVYTEKPLSSNYAHGVQLIAQASAHNLLIGSAPDTFLGAAGRRARALLDADSIGTPITGTAFMLGHGMEHAHPDPQFYYQPGAGPLFDMGPYYLTMLINLLGSVRRVVAMSCTGYKERLITAEGPLRNSTFPVGTPTSIFSVLEFESNAVISFGTSWDVYRHSNHYIEIHGTTGSMRLPDPDTFGGTVSVSSLGQPWTDYPTENDLFGKINFPFSKPTIANYRMIAVADMARAIRNNKKPITNAELALHVLDIMECIDQSAQHGSAINTRSSVNRPPALSHEAAAALCQSTAT